MEHRACLDAEERRLRTALSATEAVPFLGHHPLAAGVAQALQAELRNPVQLDLTRRLRGLFLKWPATTAAWIAGCVARDYGSVAANELYPHLALELGEVLPPGDVRQLLGRHFQATCRRLDLPVADVERAVDSYVVQAGVPEAHIANLVESMLKTERRQGLPDADDEMSCAAFCREAAGMLPRGVPRLARILEHDVDGVYARLWAAARREAAILPDDAFTSRLRDELAQQQVALPTSLRPALVWQEGGPALRLPAGSGRRWVVDSTGLHRELTGDDTPQIVPLLLAARRGPLTWREETFGMEGSIELWSNSSTVLLFQPTTGRLLGYGRLATTVEASEVRLPRGPVLAIAVANLRMGEVESDESFAPGLHELALELGHEPLALHRGTLTLRLRPSLRPELSLEGIAITDAEDRMVYLGGGLHIVLDWPREAIAQDVAYELKIGIAGEEVARLRIEDPTACTLPLDGALALAAPGLWTLRGELVRTGEQRALARLSRIVWIGIDDFDGRRFRGRAPHNLEHGATVGAEADSQGVVITAGPTVPLAKLRFAEFDGPGTGTMLAFVRPGINVALVVTDHAGRRRCEPLGTNARVVVRPGDMRQLEVTCTDRRARLVVAGREHGCVFAARSRFTLHLAAIEAGRCDRLTVVGSEGINLALAQIRFAVPMGVVRWERAIDRAAGEARLLLSLDEAADGVAVAARDLASNRSFRLELIADGLWQSDPLTGATLRLERDLGEACHTLCLMARLADWPDGLWLLDLELAATDRVGWLAPTNSRGDDYAWRVDRTSLVGRGGDPDLADLAQASALFRRLHAELQRCFALDCWQDDLDRLETYWRRAARRLAASPAGPPWAEILPLAFLDPPVDASESWLPLRSLWEPFPTHLAQPATVYACLADIERSDAATVNLLSKITAAGGLAAFARASSRLDNRFLQHFANFAAMAQGSATGELRGFDWKAYRAHILADLARSVATNDAPLLLGAEHHREALEAFARRYEMLTSGEGNVWRVPTAARLATDASRWLDRQGRRALLETARFTSVDAVSLAVVPLAVETDDSIQGAAILTLSAVALACRLEPRRPGTLKNFPGTIGEDALSPERLASTLHFLTAAGREAFALYLLLWEAIIATEAPCPT